jgi:hypothetical protein
VCTRAALHHLTRGALTSHQGAGCRFTQLQPSQHGATGTAGLPETAGAMLRVDRMRPPRHPTTLPTCFTFTKGSRGYRAVLELGAPLRLVVCGVVLLALDSCREAAGGVRWTDRGRTGEVELQKHCTAGYARCDEQLKRLSLWRRIGESVQFESMAGLSFERSRDWLHASVLVGSGRRRPRTLQLHNHH